MSLPLTVTMHCACLAPLPLLFMVLLQIRSNAQVRPFATGTDQWKEAGKEFRSAQLWRQPLSCFLTQICSLVIYTKPDKQAALSGTWSGISRAAQSISPVAAERLVESGWQTDIQMHAGQGGQGNEVIHIPCLRQREDEGKHHSTQILLPSVQRRQH